MDSVSARRVDLVHIRKGSTEWLKMLYGPHHQRAILFSGDTDRPDPR